MPPRRGASSTATASRPPTRPRRWPASSPPSAATRAPAWPWSPTSWPACCRARPTAPSSTWASGASSSCSSTPTSLGDKEGYFDAIEDMVAQVRAAEVLPGPGGVPARRARMAGLRGPTGRGPDRLPGLGRGQPRPGGRATRDRPRRARRGHDGGAPDDGARPGGTPCATTPATPTWSRPARCSTGSRAASAPGPRRSSATTRAGPATGWSSRACRPIPVGRLGIAGNRLDDPKTDGAHRPGLRRPQPGRPRPPRAASTSRRSTASSARSCTRASTCSRSPSPTATWRRRCSSATTTGCVDYCSAAPDRLIGIGCLPIPDVDAALAEMQRAADAGRAGLRHPRPRRPRTGPTTTPTTTRSGRPRRTTGVPLTMHIFTGTTLDGGLPEHWGTPGGTIKGYTFAHTDGGQHDDRPHLRRRRASASPACAFVLAEFETGWVAHFLQRLDHATYRTPNVRRRLPDDEAVATTSAATSRSPSRTTRPASLTRHLIGVDNLLWGNDYPHHDAIWPHSMEILDKIFADVPDDERERMCFSQRRRALRHRRRPSSPPPPGQA